MQQHCEDCYCARDGRATEQNMLWICSRAPARSLRPWRTMLFALWIGGRDQGRAWLRPPELHTRWTGAIRGGRSTHTPARMAPLQLQASRFRCQTRSSAHLVMKVDEHYLLRITPVA
jgi:hypothetical protein